MKYGETLRQRSIPAWAHHNIDYDDIKHVIKENTTPGKGKAVSVPGRGEEKLLEFENGLFHILAEQHHRINLFVKSKAGEIQRRLDHSKKQLRSLSTRPSHADDKRIPVGRLERYGKLENDVVKAGDEIRSLARFIATQRTAFRKLLKKYKKWTGSADLEDRFREEVLDDPKSFTKLDLGPLLDDYSATRQSIRTLYETQVQQAAGGKKRGVKEPATTSSSTIKQLREAVDSGSKVFFDTSIATVPFGENGQFASYFVHHESIIELQMLLLQHARFYLSRSRQNSIATPVTSEPQSPSFTNFHPTDYYMLVADDLERFAKEQSALTVNDREHLPGNSPQRAKASVRWNDTEDALASLRARSGEMKSAYLKKKHIQDFFEKGTEFSAKPDASLADSSERVEVLRNELLADNIRPLFHFSSCRSRLVGLDDDADGLVLATLDTSIAIGKASQGSVGLTKSAFPFALLLIRQEGKPKSELLSVLDKSHLVERVRGFSLEYHSIWQTHRPDTIPAPFWLPMLSQDIRKLPPPVTKRPSTNGRTSSSGTHSARSSGSAAGTLDSATAVEETSKDIASGLETPPLKSFRKKKRRAYPEAQTPTQKYWSEYDNPEDEDPDTYYIYVDPNETNAFDRFFEKFAEIFRGRKRKAEEDPLLSPGTPPGDEEESSDEETDLETGTSHHHKPANSFGTFARPKSIAGTTRSRDVHANTASLPQFSAICFAASIALLVMAYILRSTGRHKFIQEVHFGVWFSMVCSLMFVLLGFTNVLRIGGKSDSANARTPSLAAWTISVVVLVVDVVGSGGLLAWIMG